MSRTQIQAWIWEAGVHLGFEDVCSKIEELIGDSAILEGLKDLQYTRLLFACRKLKKLTKSINATRDYGKPVEDLLTVVINLLRNKIVYDYKTLIEQLVSLYQSTILFEYTLANDYGDTERDREDSLSLSLPFNEEKWEKVKRILDFKNDLYKDMVRKIASFELYYKSLVQPESKKNYDLLCSSLRSKIKKLLHDLMALVKKFRQPYIVNVCSNPNELKRLNFVYHRIILDNIENNTVSAEALHRMIDQLPRLSTSSVESNHSDCTIVETSFTLPTSGDNKISYRFSSNENINQRIDNDGGKPIGEPFIHSYARNFNITVNDLGQEREKALQCRHIKRKKYDIVVLKGEEYIKQNLNVADDDVELMANKINEGSDKICNNGVKSSILHTDVSEELGKIITPLPDVLRVSDKATTLQTDVSKEPDNSFNQLCTDISKLDNLITSVKDLVKELEKKCELMKVKRDAVLRHNNASDNQKCNSELPNLNNCAIESQQNENISDQLINEEATKSSKTDARLNCNAVINNVEDCNGTKHEANLNFNISTNILNENAEKNDSVKTQDNNSTDISKDVNTSKFQDNINDSESNMNSKNNTSSNNDNKSIPMPSLSLQADIIDMDISNTNNIKPDSLGVKTSTLNVGEQTDGGCKHNSMPNLSTYDAHDRSNNINKKDYNSSFMTPNPSGKKRTSGDDIDGNCNDTTSVSNLINYEGNDSPRERNISEPSDSLKVKAMDCCISSNEESNEDKSLLDPTRCEGNDGHNTRNILESSLSDAHNTRNILENSLSDAHNTRNILESSSVSILPLQGKLPRSFVNLNHLSSKVLKRIERHSFILVNDMYPNTKGMNRSPEGLSKIHIRVTPQHDLNDSPAIILETNILDYSDTRKISLQDAPTSGKRKLDIEDGLEEASVKKSRLVAVEECCTSESSETITQKESLLSQQPPESFEMFLKVLKEKSEITENFSSDLPTITSPEISLLINSAAESGNDCDENILNSAYKTSLQSSGPRSPATPQKEVSVSTEEQEGKGRELTGTESSSENSLKDFAPQKLMEKLLAKLHNIISSDDEDKDRDDDEDNDRDDDDEDNDRDDDEDKDRDDNEDKDRDDDEDNDRDDDEDNDRDDDDDNDRDDDEDKDKDDDDDNDRDDNEDGNNSQHRKDKKVDRQRKKKKNSPLDSEEITEQEEKKTNNHNKKKKKTKATKNNANSEDEVKENTENKDNVNSKNTVTRSKLNSHTEEGLSLSTSSSDLVVVNKHRPHVILADVFTDGSSTSAKVSPNSSSTEFYTPDSTKELVSVDDDEDDISVVFDSFPVHNTRHRSKIRLSQTEASKPPTVVNGDLGKPKRQQASKSTRGKPYDLNKERKLR